MKILHNIHGWINNEMPAEGETYQVAHGGKLVNGVLTGHGYHTDVYTTVEPVAPVNTKLTRIKFKQRMTQAERIAVRAAGQTDPIIFDFMDLVSEATYIDLSLPETMQGVQYLEQQGHLAVGRASEILDTPVSDDEAYNG